MSIAHPTPEQLRDAGYVIHEGTEEDGDLSGLFWWTWSVGSGIECSPDNFETLGDAIDDAWLDYRVGAWPFPA